MIGLAAVENTAVSVESILLNLGLPGVVILALAWYARANIKSTDERAKRLEDDNRRLYQIMADQMIPALTKATTAVADATAVMGEIKRRDEISAAVEAARKARDES